MFFEKYPQVLFLNNFKVETYILFFIKYIIYYFWLCRYYEKRGHLYILIYKIIISLTFMKTICIVGIY